MNEQTFNQFFPRAFVPGTIEPFMNRGEWAIHDVLPIIFNQTGTFDVKLATFNISEDSLRPMFFMAERGEINLIQMLLDMNVKRHKLDILLFAAHISPHIRLDNNHAKIFLIKSKTQAFGIVGSQNLNQPKRNEAGFYFTSGPHFDFFETKFDMLFNEAIAYELD